MIDRVKLENERKLMDSPHTCSFVGEGTPKDSHKISTKFNVKRGLKLKQLDRKNG